MHRLLEVTPWLALQSKVLAALAAVSCVAPPAMAQEPVQDPEDELIECYCGGDLMTGAVLTGESEIADGKDAPPDLPTIEDDGR